MTSKANIEAARAALRRILEAENQGDTHWITINGTHVQVDGKGSIVSGPKELTGQNVSKIEKAGDKPKAQGGPSAPPPVSKSATPDKTPGQSARQIDAPRITYMDPNQIAAQKDVKQFKEGANAETGEVEPLEGHYDHRGSGPLQVWQRLDGTHEVISGRHRLAHAKRNGVSEVPVQVYREADGFTREHALAMDAELNIRDGNGSVADYARHFSGNPNMSEDEAKNKGLLGRAKGQMGWHIGRGGTENLKALHAAKKISDSKAAAIAKHAPNDDRLQKIGLTMANEGKPAEHIENMMMAMKVQKKAQGGDLNQKELFGDNDSAMQEMEQAATKAMQMRRDITNRIHAVKGAANRPEVAREMGVNVGDPEAIKGEVKRLEGEAERWKNWAVHPDLAAQVFGRDMTPAAPAPAAGTDLFGQPTGKPQASAGPDMFGNMFADSGKQSKPAGQSEDPLAWLDKPQDAKTDGTADMFGGLFSPDRQGPSEPPKVAQGIDEVQGSGVTKDELRNGPSGGQFHEIGTDLRKAGMDNLNAKPKANPDYKPPQGFKPPESKEDFESRLNKALDAHEEHNGNVQKYMAAQTAKLTKNADGRHVAKDPVTGLEMSLSKDPEVANKWASEYFGQKAQMAADKREQAKADARNLHDFANAHDGDPFGQSKSDDQGYPNPAQDALHGDYPDNPEADKQPQAGPATGDKPKRFWEPKGQVPEFHAATGYKFKKMKGLTPEEQQEEAALHQYAQDNYEELRDKYLQKEGLAHFGDDGNLKSVNLNIDEWRDFLPGYKGTNPHVNQTTGHYLNSRLTHEMLHEMRGKGNNKIAVLAGGGGSGKTSAVKNYYNLKDYPIVLDQVTGDLDKANQAFDMADKNGFDAHYIYVDRNPNDAWKDGVIKRAQSLHDKWTKWDQGGRQGDEPAKGRTVPLDVAVHDNFGARQTAHELVKQGRQIDVIDNNHGHGFAKKYLDPKQQLEHFEKTNHDLDSVTRRAIDDTRELHGSGGLSDLHAAALLGRHASGNGHVQPAQPAAGDSGRLPDAADRPAESGGVGGQGKGLGAGPSPGEAAQGPATPASPAGPGKPPAIAAAGYKPYRAEPGTTGKRAKRSALTKGTVDDVRAEVDRLGHEMSKLSKSDPKYRILYKQQHHTKAKLAKLLAGGGGADSSALPSAPSSASFAAPQAGPGAPPAVSDFSPERMAEIEKKWERNKKIINDRVDNPKPTKADKELAQTNKDIAGVAQRAGDLEKELRAKGYHDLADEAKGVADRAQSNLGNGKGKADKGAKDPVQELKRLAITQAGFGVGGMSGMLAAHEDNPEHMRHIADALGVGKFSDKYDLAQKFYQREGYSPEDAKGFAQKIQKMDQHRAGQATDLNDSQKETAISSHKFATNTRKAWEKEFGGIPAAQSGPSNTAREMFEKGRAKVEIPKNHREMMAKDPLDEKGNYRSDLDMEQENYLSGGEPETHRRLRIDGRKNPDSKGDGFDPYKYPGYLGQVVNGDLETGRFNHKKANVLREKLKNSSLSTDPTLAAYHKERLDWLDQLTKSDHHLGGAHPRAMSPEAAGKLPPTPDEEKAAQLRAEYSKSSANFGKQLRDWLKNTDPMPDGPDRLAGAFGHADYLDARRDFLNKVPEDQEGPHTHKENLLRAAVEKAGDNHKPFLDYYAKNYKDAHAGLVGKLKNLPGSPEAWAQKVLDHAGGGQATAQAGGKQPYEQEFAQYMRTQPEWEQHQLGEKSNRAYLMNSARNAMMDRHFESVLGAAQAGKWDKIHPSILAQHFGALRDLPGFPGLKGGGREDEPEAKPETIQGKPVEGNTAGDEYTRGQIAKFDAEVAQSAKDRGLNTPSHAMFSNGTLARHLDDLSTQAGRNKLLDHVRDNHPDLYDHLRNPENRKYWSNQKAQLETHLDINPKGPEAKPQGGTVLADLDTKLNNATAKDTFNDDENNTLGTNEAINSLLKAKGLRDQDAVLDHLRANHYHIYDALNNRDDFGPGGGQLRNRFKDHYQRNEVGVPVRSTQAVQDAAAQPGPSAPPPVSDAAPAKAPRKSPERLDGSKYFNPDGTLNADSLKADINARGGMWQTDSDSKNAFRVLRAAIQGAPDNKGAYAALDHAQMNHPAVFSHALAEAKYGNMPYHDLIANHYELRHGQPMRRSGGRMGGTLPSKAYQDAPGEVKAQTPPAEAPASTPAPAPAEAAPAKPAAPANVMPKVSRGMMFNRTGDSAPYHLSRIFKPASDPGRFYVHLDQHGGTGDRHVMTGAEFIKKINGGEFSHNADAKPDAKWNEFHGTTSLPTVSKPGETPAAPAPAPAAPESPPETGWRDDGKPISVNDPDAHIKLAARIRDSKARLEKMKLVNSVMRKHAGKSIRDGYGNGYTPTWKKGKSAETAAAELRGAGLNSLEIQQALKPGAFGHMGHAPFEITNLNANIRRMSDRIADVEQHRRNTAKAAPEQSYSTRPADPAQADGGQVSKSVSGVTVSEHPEEGRMRIRFPGKPDARQIDLLKRHGFKWAPSQGAWSRILTDNARYSAKMLMSSLGLAKDAQESHRPKPQVKVSDLISWLTRE